MNAYKVSLSNPHNVTNDGDTFIVEADGHLEALKKVADDSATLINYGSVQIQETNTNIVS